MGGGGVGGQELAPPGFASTRCHGSVYGGEEQCVAFGCQAHQDSVPTMALQPSYCVKIAALNIVLLLVVFLSLACADWVLRGVGQKAWF